MLWQQHNTEYFAKVFSVICRNTYKMQFCWLSDGVLTHLRWSEQSWPGAETRLEISWWNFHHRGEAARQKPSSGAALRRQHCSLQVDA